MATTEQQADAYSMKLEAEMAKWEQQYKRERRLGEEAAEARVQQYREARDLAQADADKWHDRYAEVKKAHDEHMLRAAEASAAAEVQLSQLRSDLKVKTFEAERLALHCEESMAGSRRCEIKSESWREKYELVKSEYYALQTTSAERWAAPRPLPARALSRRPTPFPRSPPLPSFAPFVVAAALNAAGGASRHAAFAG